MKSKQEDHEKEAEGRFRLNRNVNSFAWKQGPTKLSKNTENGSKNRYCK